MTEDIPYRDAYARSVEARVVSVEPLDGGGHAVVLDRTVFYPGGGGQPSDAGWLTGAGERRWIVRGARRSSGDIVHELGPEPEPAGDGGRSTGAGAGVAGAHARAPVPGETVTAEIDWERRHLLMRTHTALHTLCGVVWRDYGALVTGGNMEPGRGRLDFEFETLSSELVGTIETAVNAELAAERPVHVGVLPRDEAFAIPDLIRTKVNLLPEGIAQVRVIEIEGLDLQADGGTHVANTREVGQIRVTGYESKGRINKRIRIELVGG